MPEVGGNGNRLGAEVLLPEYRILGKPGVHMLI